MKNCNFSPAMKQHHSQAHKRSKALTGILIVAVGVLILMKQTGVILPHWLLSWKMLLIAIGIISLVKHNFRQLWGVVLIGIGSLFILKDFYPNTIDTKFIWPAVLIIIGISMLYKLFFSGNNDFKKSMNNVSGEDYFESNTVFGSVDKKMVSKNFKGADLNAVFGGNEIDLTQADFTGEAIINARAVFGGISLIIPASWTVKSELTSVFGGIEDKRASYVITDQDSTKVLIIKGSCVFGGIEINSYQ